MADDRAAMSELRAILESRRAAAKARVTVDTTGIALEKLVAAISAEKK